MLIARCEAPPTPQPPPACGNSYFRLRLPWELSIWPPIGPKAGAAARIGRRSGGRGRVLGNVLHSLDVGVSSTHTYKMSNIRVSIQRPTGTLQGNGGKPARNGKKRMGGN
jgi:hypothetical protein